MIEVGVDASNLRLGGGITHLVELLRAAEPEKHGISRVIVWGGKTTLEKIDERPWLERAYEPALDQLLPVRLLWQAVRLSKLAQEHCDVLFVPGGSCPGTFRPFVTMSRNLLPFEIEEKRRYGASWMFLKLSLLKVGQIKSLQKAEGVIFLNAYARSTIIGHTGLLAAKIATIPHGVCARFIRPPEVQKSLADYSIDCPFRLLYISIIDVYKHQCEVVEAVAELRQSGIPVALNLGGPAYPPSLRRLRKVMRRVDPRGTFVRYLGPVSYDNLAGHYHSADAFVFASSCENMPNILLEAMAAGLPIACSNRGPMPDVLGDAGLYFDPENQGEVAEALRKLLEQPELRATLAQKAYERSKTYSWQRCADETFAFITETHRSTWKTRNTRQGVRH